MRGRWWFRRSGRERCDSRDGGKELGAALAGVPQKGVIQAKQANLGMLVPPMEGHPGRLVCQACQAT